MKLYCDRSTDPATFIIKDISMRELATLDTCVSMSLDHFVKPDTTGSYERVKALLEILDAPYDEMPRDGH